MNRWTIERDFSTQCWKLRKEMEIYRQYPRGNGSRQSGYLQCQRELARILAEELFTDCPELAYRTAYLATELVKESGLAVSFSQPER